MLPSASVRLYSVLDVSFTDDGVLSLNLAISPYYRRSFTKNSSLDKHLDENKNEIEHLPEKEQELLKLKDDAYISTTDDDGHVSWGEITAITRHDPGKEMYKIYTESGRDVKVVESKSLIVWNEELKKRPNVIASIQTLENLRSNPIPVKRGPGLKPYYYITKTDLEKIKQDSSLSDTEKELKSSALNSEYQVLRQKFHLQRLIRIFDLQFLE